MSNLRQKLKKIPALKVAVLSARLLRNPHSLSKKLHMIRWYVKDFRAFRTLTANPAAIADVTNLYPCIYDKTDTTPLDPVYFYQNAWCAGKIFTTKPSHHHDVGSSAHMIGIISQFVPTTMIDIRPITLTSLPNLFFKTGDINKLPFGDNEIESLSSICVIEHIGLGRYGDTLDPFGTEKAARELGRVLAKGGNLYISVPIDSDNKLYFNAHRAFTPSYVIKQLFPTLTLIEEKYIYGESMFDSYDNKRGFGTGLFHFKKA